MATLRRLSFARHQDEEGQSLVEYGLIISLVVIVCVVALISLGQGILSKLYVPAQSMC